MTPPLYLVGMGWYPFMEFEMPRPRELECIGGPRDGETLQLPHGNEFRYTDLTNGYRVVHVYRTGFDRRGRAHLFYAERIELTPR